MSSQYIGSSIKDYHIHNAIGQGGFATVCKATCIRTGQEVAIKMIDRKRIGSSERASRVLQEVQIHSRLKHPSILELYTYFLDQDYVYLILELCPNGELHRYLSKTDRKVLNESEARHFLKGIVEGMLYLQSHNILHRDLTLANILLSKNMKIKIADFGLATQLTNANEKHTTMCGTPNFMAPEMITGSPHGLESDLWSLGCMLYTFLIGRPPFDTGVVRSTLTHAVMTEYFVPEGISSDAKDLLRLLLKKDPGHRLELSAVKYHSFMTKASEENYFVLHNKWITANSVDSGVGTTGTFSTTPSSRTTSRGSRARPMMALPHSSLPTLTSQTEYDHQRQQQEGENRSWVTSGEVRDSCRRSGRMAPQSSPSPTSGRSSPRLHSHSDRLGVVPRPFLPVVPNVPHEEMLPTPSRCERDASEERRRHGLRDANPKEGSGCSCSSSSACAAARQRNQVGRCPRGGQHREMDGACKTSTANSYDDKRLERRCGAEENDCQHGGVKRNCRELQTRRSPIQVDTTQCSHHCICEQLGSCSHHESCSCRPTDPFLAETEGNRRRCDVRTKSPRPHTAIRSVFSGRQADGRCSPVNVNIKTPSVPLAEQGKKLEDVTPPLNSSRLQATRQKTKNAVLSILGNGDICLELVGIRGNQERIVDVCRISSDGKRIIVYRPNNGKGQKLATSPPDIPRNGADGIYGYDNLPAKYWKKYTYAARFVELVRSKTPKIILYKRQAKFMLMENSPSADFEATFSTGEKISQTSNEIKIIEKDGASYSMESVGGASGLRPSVRELWELFQKYHRYCLELESITTKSDAETDECSFPVILRRKATVAQSTAPSHAIRDKENMPANALRDRGNHQNQNSVAQSEGQLSLGTAMNRLMYQESSSAPNGKKNMPRKSAKGTASQRSLDSGTQLGNISTKQVFVPNIGWAAQVRTKSCVKKTAIVEKAARKKQALFNVKDESAQESAIINIANTNNITCTGRPIYYHLK